MHAGGCALNEQKGVDTKQLVPPADHLSSRKEITENAVIQYL